MATKSNPPVRAAHTDHDLWASMQAMHDEVGAMRADLGRAHSKIDALEEELATARTELVQLRQPKAQPHDGEVIVAVDTNESEDAQVSSRRALLKKAGIGTAVTAAGVAAMAKPAAAADGDPLLAGNFTTAQTRTGLRGVSNDDFGILRVDDGTTTAFPSADVLSAWSGDNTDNAIWAYKTGRTDDDADTGFPLVSATFRTARGHLLFTSIVNNGFEDPRQSDIGYQQGSVLFDENEDLWVCVRSGTPGTWRKVVGPDTAGALHPINPQRVWDTRFQGGALGAGENRRISIKDGRALSSPNIATPNVVPDGATAITFNLTIVSTSRAGWLAVTPGDAFTNSASSINWAAQGTVIANGTMTTLDDDRQVRVWASPTGSAHFLIDVTGYYL